EGPFVLKYKNRYYQMFSGGNWKNETYGASYATSPRIDVPDEWHQASDGERVMPILRTIPGEVIGPGHNSVVRGPDNQQLFCVYHRWEPEVNDRVLAIDRLDWAGERMLVVGPSTTPQPAPLAPSFADSFENEQKNGLGDGWRCTGGRWGAGNGAARQAQARGEAEALCLVSTPYFIAEVSVRMPDKGSGRGAAGIRLLNEQEAVLSFTLAPGAGQAVVAAQSDGQWVKQCLTLPAQFDSSAFPLLRVEVNAQRVAVAVDGATLKWEGTLGSQASSLALITEDAAAEFGGLALTRGWQDLFTGQDSDPAAWNWRAPANDDRWRVDEDQLWYAGPHGESSILTKGILPDEYELVVSARLMCEAGPGEGYGFLPALNEAGYSPLLTVERHEKGWAVCCDTRPDRQVFPLPVGFDPFEYQQFRFRRERGALVIQHEARTLGEIDATGEPRKVGLYGYRVIAAFDQVRVTAIHLS